MSHRNYSNKNNKASESLEKKPDAPKVVKTSKAGCPNDTCEDPEVCRTIFRCKLLK